MPLREGSDHLPLGDETVLLAEDEPSVRGVAAKVLSQLGYTVLEAANGHDALRVARDLADEELHLLLTDVVMPLMGGEELVEQLKVIRPNTKVLFTSGYTDAIVGPQLTGCGAEAIRKPYGPATLARRVREVLDM